MEPTERVRSSTLGSTDETRRRAFGPFLPMLLIALSLLSWLGFQGVQLGLEQRQLKQAHASLDAQHEAATKLRAALDSLATATAKLAAEGHANARVVVEELRKRGITIRR
jgi:cell division protein FtsB